MMHDTGSDGPQGERKHPSLDTVAVGDRLPTRRHEATTVSLFLYNAAVWNPHRIHYDEPYTTGVEGHAGVVIDGPLQGDWLSQVVLNWLGDAGRLVSFEYSNRGAAHIGDVLVSSGVVSDVDRGTGTIDVDLAISTSDGDVITPGRATVHLDQ